jgi:hypothetical protein
MLSPQPAVLAANSSSKSTSSLICIRNQRSIFVRLKISSMVRPEEEDPLGVRHAQLSRNNAARQNIPVAIHFIADAPGLAVAAQTAAANLRVARATRPHYVKSVGYPAGVSVRVGSTNRPADAAAVAELHKGVSS